MTSAVRDAYDSMAPLYAKVALGDLDKPTPDRDWLAAFADAVDPHGGPVADLGCGPGHVTHHLAELGLPAVGYDFSPGQIIEARRAFPHLRFEVGDLTTLDAGDASLGGIVSRYSLIHIEPARFDQIFREWHRSLQPGAPVLVSFFAAASAARHGTPFDHKVVTAHELFAPVVAGQLRDTGFVEVEIGMRTPIPGERPLDHATVLARRSGG